MINIKYDPEADAIYILFKGHGVDHIVRVGPDLAIDCGLDGEIHGIEILSAKERLGIAKVPEITLENINVAE